MGCCHGTIKEECPVCLTDMDANLFITKTQCGHYFHKRCLDEWIKKEPATCPICRTLLKA